MKFILKSIVFVIALVLIIIVSVILGSALINSYVKIEGRSMIVATLAGEDPESDGADIGAPLKDEEVRQKIKDLDPECAIVLGAGITNSETPSPMLKERLDASILLYREGLVKKLLLTGDNGQAHHNEIHVMLKYCIDAGIPGKSIFCDHAGFSTYDSMYRAYNIFEVKRAIVVTQSYHIYRALYLAKKRGIKVLGVASDQRRHVGQEARDVREFLARVKDFFKQIKNSPSTFGGEKIPISGDDGRISHGEDI